MKVVITTGTDETVLVRLVDELSLSGVRVDVLRDERGEWSLEVPVVQEAYARSIVDKILRPGVSRIEDKIAVASGDKHKRTLVNWGPLFWIVGIVAVPAAFIVLLEMSKDDSPFGIEPPSDCLAYAVSRAEGSDPSGWAALDSWAHDDFHVEVKFGRLTAESFDGRTYHHGLGRPRGLEDTTEIHAYVLQRKRFLWVMPRRPDLVLCRVAIADLAEHRAKIEQLMRTYFAVH